MQKTLILMRKIKIKEKQGGGRLFKLSSTCWNGGQQNDVRWDLWGRGGKTKFAA